ncbi:MAG TPA: acyl-CoA dehydrogenase, partial [Deltaproteobacteria bacterium]|nr:acyl-CoA dehydrogenase [Deltaproteobacteria bacterium]
MALPQRDNPYSFDDFLAWRRNIDYYRDDAFLHKVLRRYAGSSWEAVEHAMQSFSPKVSVRWRDMADTLAMPEKRPFLIHYDG